MTVSIEPPHCGTVPTWLVQHRTATTALPGHDAEPLGSLPTRTPGSQMATGQGARQTWRR